MNISKIKLLKRLRLASTVTNYILFFSAIVGLALTVWEYYTIFMGKPLLSLFPDYIHDTVITLVALSGIFTYWYMMVVGKEGEAVLAKAKPDDETLTLQSQKVKFWREFFALKEEGVLVLGKHFVLQAEYIFIRTSLVFKIMLDCGSLPGMTDVELYNLILDDAEDKPQITKKWFYLAANQFRCHVFRIDDIWELTKNRNLKIKN